MKNIIFTIIAFFAIQAAHACSVSFTASVSGATVTISSTFTPPAYAGSVNVITTWSMGDSNNSYANSNGTYTYPKAGAYTIKFVMLWEDSNTHAYICSDSVSHTVTTTVNGPAQIGGMVGRDTVSGVWTKITYKVWLITYDSATQNLAAVDSLTTPLGFTYERFTFNNVHAGQYRLKAMMVDSTVGGTGPIPTYSYDSLYWSGAQVINYSGLGVSGGDIHLQEGIVTTGPGFISGNVTSGANKGTKVTGLPAAGIEILLENMSGAPLAYMLTDANGNYQFSNIPVGTYKVYPEILGYTTIPSIVTVGNTQVTNVNFIQHTISKSAEPANLGVTTIAANNMFSISPNPGAGVFSIAWATATPLQNTHAIVTDVAGRKVYETVLNMNSATGKTQLNLSQLQPGMYFININAGTINYTNKVVVQH